MERLQKVMAHAGVASRRKCESIIEEGRVKVNGQVVTELGVKVSSSDRITVDDIPIGKEERVYYLFYKPQNVLSSVSDDRGRPVVTDYLKVDQRIYPVGRLDFDTTGALIMTNDGDFSHYMAHPSHEVDKEYQATLEGLITNEALKQLRLGVRLEQGVTSPAKTKLLKRDPKKNISVVNITIHEGWNHQVKLMFQTVGFPVKRLHRIRIGHLKLDGMIPGEYRRIKPFELKQLRGEA